MLQRACTGGGLMGCWARQGKLPVASCEPRAARPGPAQVCTVHHPSCPALCHLQAHRAVLPQLPCRVVAAVPQEELAAVPWACQEDPRRTAKFMSYALTAAAEASATGCSCYCA